MSCEIKPKFYKPPKATMIKFMQPFKRPAIDFERFHLSSSKNRFLLTIINEFSCLEFVYPCEDTPSRSFILCLNSFFSIFQYSVIIHNDNSKCFPLNEIKQFFIKCEIATSFSSIA